jgi:hypothetical protein
MKANLSHNNQYDFDFLEDADTIEIVDCNTDTLYRLPASKSDIQLHANGGTKSAECENGWDYENEEPTYATSYYTEIVVCHEEVKAYALANKDAWGAGVKLEG